MYIIRPELNALAKACERLLSDALKPGLTQEERSFVFHYGAELVKQFARSSCNGPTDGSQLLLPIVTRQAGPAIGNARGPGDQSRPLLPGSN